MRRACRQAAGFAKDQDGTTTVFGIFLFVTVLVIAGLALDVANAYRIRTHLQVAGDAAGHAALVAREFNSPAVAKAKALEIADVHLPSAKFGSILRSEDIVFGYWDEEDNDFDADPYAFDAVLVNTGRAQDRSNSVSTYLLKFAGIDGFNVRRQTVFETYRPTCFREGFVGEDIVEVTSGNQYTSGFCVHSNTHVSVNSGNDFAPGTIVSMPDRREIELPASGFESNPGLETALRDGSYKIRILQRIDAIIAGVQDPSSAYYRDFISNSIPISLSRNGKNDADTFTEGRIHKISCNSPNQNTKIHAGTVLENVVIWTNCEMMFGEGVELRNVTIVNESTSVKSFNSASGIQIGTDDHCKEGGGAQLVTRGGIDFPAQLKMYGGQMIAAKDIAFTAEADGIEGASVISGGRIDGTSGSVMGFCGGSGMENNFEAEYFRLAF